MIESHDYRVDLIAGPDRTAELTSPDGALSALNVASPPEFGGPDDLWSPEHLYVASISTCLMTTFFAIADIARLEVVSYSDEALGHLQRGEDRLYSMDRVVLRPRVVVESEGDVAKANRLLDKAEKVCLISRSVVSAVEMRPAVSVAQPVAR